MRELIKPSVGMSRAALIVLNSAEQLCWSLWERISDLVRMDDGDIDIADIVWVKLVAGELGQIAFSHLKL